MITEKSSSLAAPRRRRAWPVWLAVATIVAVAAGLYVSTHKAPEAAGHGRMAGPVPVFAGTVKRADVPVKLGAIGTVEAAETVSVRAQASGQILSVGFKEGARIEKGQVLFQLDPAPLAAALKQAEATMARDRAQLAQARSDERRFSDLASQGFVSRQQAEQSAASAHALQATVAADEAMVENARVQLSYATVRAPISGVAGERLVDVGNVVRAGDASPLVVINRVTPVLVGFTVPQTEIERVRQAMAAGPVGATVTPRGGTPQEGQVVFLDNAVDADTGTLKLQARVPNENRLLVPGQFVDVTMILTIEKNRVIAPTQAVLPTQDGHLVFVIKPDGTVTQRPVKVDRVLGEQTVIASGLEAGERVVTDGTLQLREGSKVDVRDTLVPPSPQGRRH